VSLLQPEDPRMNRPRLRSLCLGLFGVGICILAGARQTAAPTSGGAPAGIPRSISAVFKCESGRSIHAVFRSGPPSSVDLTLSDGRRVTLSQVASGSGARYATADESFVFWNKGRTAFVTEAGKQTYGGCRQTH
jgi:membrane-bound inhibitor of C-type lysozyme